MDVDLFFLNDEILIHVTQEKNAHLNLAAKIGLNIMTPINILNILQQGH